MITDLQDAENRGFILGFDACNRIDTKLNAAAFFAGIMCGLLAATIIIWSI